MLYKLLTKLYYISGIAYQRIALYFQAQLVYFPHSDLPQNTRIPQTDIHHIQTDSSPYVP